MLLATYTTRRGEMIDLRCDPSDSDTIIAAKIAAFLKAMRADNYNPPMFGVMQVRDYFAFMATARAA